MGTCRRVMKVKVESYQAYNPKALMKFKLGKRLKDSYTKTNDILGRVEEIRPDIIDEFIDAFGSRISDVIGETVIDINLECVIELIQDLDYLKNNSNLLLLLTRYIIFQLEIPSELGNLDREIEVYSFNHARENERLRYYLAKACPDILGREQGIEFWKRIVTLTLRDARVEFESREKERIKSGKNEICMIEGSDGAIKWWIETGVGDFTRAILDDHKILYRFDKCITPEVLKDLDDPEFAYLSSCYIGDAPGFNFGRRFLRRTQTLHTSSFCDELYWDPRVHDEPEQPSLEFTKKL